MDEPVYENRITYKENPKVDKGVFGLTCSRECAVWNNQWLQDHWKCKFYITECEEVE